MSKGTKVALATVACVLIATLYFMFDPATSTLAPKCAFHAATGWDCPGCGTQRMIHHLLHCNFKEAWSANAGIICFLPIFFVMIIAAILRTKHPKLYAAINSLPSIIIIAVALVAWGILRNFL